MTWFPCFGKSNDTPVRTPFIPPPPIPRIIVTPQSTPAPPPRQLREHHRPLSYNPGVDMTPNRFTQPLPFRPLGPPASATGKDAVANEPMMWERINPVVGDAYLGTGVYTGEKVLATHDPTGEYAPNMAAVTPAATRDGRPAVITTPAQPPWGLPTPNPSPVIPPAMPPLPPPGTGNHVYFPQTLPAGSRVTGVPDPTMPGQFWVDHPAPGPHTGATMTPGYPGAALPYGTPPPMSWTPGQPLPYGQTPRYTPGAPPAALPPTVSWPQPTPAPSISASLPPWYRHPAPVLLNPLLTPNANDGTTPYLKWDMAQMPAKGTLKYLSGQNLVLPVKDADFKQMGVHPPGMAIHIHLVHPSWPSMSAMWGPIIVSPHGKENMVSVWDVLDTVYNYLQTQIDWTEYMKFAPLGTQDPNHERMHDAYVQRCRNADSLEAYERKQGMRRIDCLGDQRRWNGLQAVYGPGNTVQWHLYLSNVKRKR